MRRASTDTAQKAIVPVTAISCYPECLLAARRSTTPGETGTDTNRTPAVESCAVGCYSGRNDLQSQYSGEIDHRPDDVCVVEAILGFVDPFNQFNDRVVRQNGRIARYYNTGIQARQAENLHC